MNEPNNNITERDVTSPAFEPLWAALRRVAGEPVSAAMLDRVKSALRAELIEAGAAGHGVGADEFAPVWTALARLPQEPVIVELIDRVKAAVRAEAEAAAGPLAEGRLVGVEFAPVWSAVAGSTERAPAGLLDRVKAAVRAEAAAARRPTVVRGVFARRVAAAAALAAALALAAWAGISYFGSTPTAPETPQPNNAPIARPAVVEHDLGAVASVPETVVEAVESLADVRSAVDSLGRSFDEMTGSAGALSLTDEFPFLEKTFEETILSGGGE
jgi:hypothetical protein